MPAPRPGTPRPQACRRNPSCAAYVCRAMPSDDSSDDRSGDAAGLLGLLADERRLKVVAALVLGAETRAEVAERAGLPARAVGQALARLAKGELVEEVDGRYRLLSARFRDAGRAAAEANAVP